MKTGIRLLLLFGALALGCYCEPAALTAADAWEHAEAEIEVSNNSAETKTAEAAINLTSGVSLELAAGTDVDASMLAKSGGKKTKFRDSEANSWDLSLREDVDADQLAASGFVSGWFPSYGEQQYFCKAFPATPAPVKDPMIDGPAVCSVYLIADEEFSVWLRRDADAVPCPDAAAYKSWLPRTRTATSSNPALY